MTHCRKEDRVPLEPFRLWLTRQAARDGWDAVAEQCGCDPRQLHRVVHESRDWVSIKLVDRCLLNSPVRLEELYPLEEVS